MVQNIKSHCDPNIGICQQNMVASPGYTPSEQVVKQADLSALQGIYKRYGDKSFDLLIEAIYRLGKDEAVIAFLVNVFATCQHTTDRLKELEHILWKEKNEKVLY